MRLVKHDGHGSFDLTKDLFDDIPPYAVLSHTWGEDEDEVTFDDLEKGTAASKSGFEKLQFCAKQAADDHLEHFWVDTCCINKTDSTEVTYAITSMFRWYRDAAMCYVYLSDVTASTQDSANDQDCWELFRKSRWFTRGWTLQELLAPKFVKFYSREGIFLGHKTALQAIIHEITSIPVTALRGVPLSEFSVDDRLQWAAGRSTKRVEDKAYCLLGIFEVFMPLIYGEGENALHRLREQIGKPSITTDYESRKRQELLEVLPWLKFNIKHEKVYDECLAGTGQWFLKSPTFVIWLEKQGGLLWCPGIPGAGKTVLASLVVEELQQICSSRNRHAVCHIYFDYDLRHGQHSAAVAGDLLAQLLHKLPTIPTEIRDRLETLRRSSVQSTKREYLTMLRLASKSFNKVFIVVDALDECTEYTHRTLVNDFQNIGPHVSILVTSRPWDSIGRIFDGSDQLRISAAKIDMEAYIRRELQDNIELSDIIDEDPGFAEKIVAMVLDRAQDMFLIASLYMQSLVPIAGKDKIIDALQILPKGLDITYGRALDRLQAQAISAQKLCIKILAWISLPCRPLTLSEMRHALSIDRDHYHLDESLHVPTVHSLASGCADLVTVDRAGDKIDLVHHTVREYLTTHVCHILPNPHLQMAKTCLTYLSFEEPDVARDKDALLRSRPFAGYAGRYWGHHAWMAYHREADVPLEADVRSLALSLLQQDSRTADVFMLEPTDQDSSDADLHRGYIKREGPKGLHIAAHFGLRVLVVALLENGAGVNCRDANGNTPLHYAAWQGSYGTIQYLIHKGADVSLENSKRASPLQCAAVNGQRDIVRLLSDHGANINYNSSVSDATLPALHEAILHDQPDVVDELLSLGADIEFISNKQHEFKSPLSCACSRHRAKCLSLLIKHSVSIEGEKGRQALSQAIPRHYFDDNACYIETLRVICSSSIDLNQDLEAGFYALDLALQFSHGTVIEQLLNANARNGQPWYSNQPAIERWARRSWFPKLTSLCSSAQDSDMSCDALQPTSFTRLKDPSAVCVVSRIIPDDDMTDLYSPYPRPLFYPDAHRITDSTLWKTTPCYMTVTVPENFVRVSQVIITTESHDQGSSLSTLHCEPYAYLLTGFNIHETEAASHGSSYSWLDVAFMYHQHPRHPIWMDRLYFNVRFKSDWTTHISVLETEDPKDDADWARADAVWNLRAGDHIILYARAAHESWQNHLRMAKIEITGLEKKPETEK
ncbi:uncharacterized protein HMPREF1541_10676 [Cyphellophora europaea CBS 101466]|uniref:Uncharacterized protein n=1 Tax=Cyphellophora europaea (strain CBS 101466) TaxID=1220924 RepID=W2S5Y7_CYPE1|nr:uncharacterized protein HMPREF1541_10676 [Cyphellophora europaea CBS 101466]ETN44126.1 hypothetical protein HMPREF1541_10676 [Cyphellophora europaea CBS 101466]